MRGEGQRQAICAGLCAAGASVFAKLAMNPSDTGMEGACRRGLDWFMWNSSFNTSTGVEFHTPDVYCSGLLWIARGIFFSLIFLCNAFMWTCYAKSLQSTTTLVATMTNTASNLFFTAISGWMIFGEDLHPVWWVGAFFIVTGLLLIHASSVDSDKDKSN